MDSSSLGERPRYVRLDPSGTLWSRAFAVAPLVLIATREGDGFDVAPKHMAMPLGWGPYYCFACSPRHATYRNALEHAAFTASFPDEELILQTGLAASGRLSDGSKPGLAALPTFPAEVVDGVLVRGCSLYLECELERVVDGFGANALVVGHVVAASARENVLRDVETDDGDLIASSGVLAYLHPGRFTTVRESLAFPVPVDLSV